MFNFTAFPSNTQGQRTLPYCNKKIEHVTKICFQEGKGKFPIHINLQHCFSSSLQMYYLPNLEISPSVMSNFCSFSSVSQVDMHDREIMKNQTTNFQRNLREVI